MFDSVPLNYRAQSSHVDAHRPAVRVRGMPAAVQRQKRPETAHGLSEPRHQLASSEPHACASHHGQRHCRMNSYSQSRDTCQNCTTRMYRKKYLGQRFPIYNHGLLGDLARDSTRCSAINLNSSYTTKLLEWVLSRIYNSHPFPIGVSRATAFHLSWSFVHAG